MKLKLSSVFEVSRYVATKPGQELREALEYLAEFSQQVVTALNAKLSYGDNFQCEIKQIQIATGTPTVIFPDSTYRIKEIRLRRIMDARFYTTSEVGWNYDPSGQPVFKCTIPGAPTGSLIPAEIIIYY